MADGPDRENVIQLLEKLGEPDDADALAAARNLHEFISDSGLTWDDLLVPEGEEGGPPDSVDLDDDEDDGAEEAESSFDDNVVPSGEAAEDVKRIDQLLERKDISAALREDLEGYKEDIQEGEFTASDRQYLNALQSRLSASSKKRARDG